MTLFYNCVWWYAIKKDELSEEDTDKRLIRPLTIEYAIAPALHLTALIICLWSVPFSIVPVLLLYIYFALPRLSEKKVKEKRGIIQLRMGKDRMYLFVTAMFKPGKNKKGSNRLKFFCLKNFCVNCFPVICFSCKAFTTGIMLS
jgi:hypothetical protein